MAKFRKVIGRPGVFRVNTPNGKEIKALTKDFWKSVYTTAKDMLSVGLRIPAPFAHKDDSGVVPSLLNAEDQDAETLTKKRWSSDINGGFWEDFEVDSKGQFIGVIEVPQDSVSDKVRKTIKETSVFIEPTFTDGLGRTWKNALRHIALVTNPVDPNQDNFELISDKQDYALAMSFSMADEIAQTEPKDTTEVNAEDTTKDATKTTSDETSSAPANITEIVSLLRDKLGYEMPSDTDENNFLDRLRTILVSIKNDEPQEEMKDLTKVPKGSETESSTVVMADEKNINDENPDNVMLFEKKIKRLLALHISSLQETLLDKINKLIRKGVIGKRKAETDLIPAVNAISMSLEDLDEDGNLPKTPIEMALDMLDEKAGLLDDIKETVEGDIEEHDDDISAMSKEETDAVYSRILS